MWWQNSVTLVEILQDLCIMSVTRLAYAHQLHLPVSQASVHCVCGTDYLFCYIKINVILFAKSSLFPPLCFFFFFYWWHLWCVDEAATPLPSSGSLPLFQARWLTCTLIPPLIFIFFNQQKEHNQKQDAQSYFRPHFFSCFFSFIAVTSSLWKLQSSVVKNWLFRVALIKHCWLQGRAQIKFKYSNQIKYLLKFRNYAKSGFKNCIRFFQNELHSSSKDHNMFYFNIKMLIVSSCVMCIFMAPRGSFPIILVKVNNR